MQRTGTYTPEAMARMLVLEGYRGHKRDLKCRLTGHVLWQLPLKGVFMSYIPVNSPSRKKLSYEMRGQTASMLGWEKLAIGDGSCQQIAV